MRRQLVTFAVALCCCGALPAQHSEHPSFGAPFDFPLLLSGNFGELRPNHFHGGLDFKTQQVEGKPIHVIEDGYVSRISVSPSGYGQALYVTHPNGFTSVYGHLKSFAPFIAEYVEAQQYAQERFDVNLFLSDSLFQVKRGEVIALSGNTGSSGGPHLHMEIRETATNEPIDPLVFYQKQIRDTRPPRATAVMFYPQPGKGVVQQGTSKRMVSLTGRKGDNQLATPVTAWGEIGLGIRAYDYMDETSNIYGVKYLTLYVDSTEVFRSVVDRFSFDENRAINGWTDYEERSEHGRWFMKSFVPKGCRLRLASHAEGTGLFRIDEARDYHVRYVLQDAYGNCSTYRFVIEGRPCEIPPYQPKGNRLLHCDQVNRLQEPGMELIVPKGMLYEDAELDVKVIADSLSTAYTYQLTQTPVPLHSYCPIAIGVCRHTVADTTKYYIAQYKGGHAYYVGGTYEKGWVKAEVRELTSFTVCVDTVPPKVTAVTSAARWGKNRSIAFQLSDGQTGIKNYKGRVDGQFVLFTCNARQRIVCDLTKTKVKRGGQHELELEVTDFCGNTTCVRQRFRY